MLQSTRGTCYQLNFFVCRYIREKPNWPRKITWRRWPRTGRVWCRKVAARTRGYTATTATTTPVPPSMAPTPPRARSRRPPCPPRRRHRPPNRWSARRAWWAAWASSSSSNLSTRTWCRRRWGPCPATWACPPTCSSTETATCSRYVCRPWFSERPRLPVCHASFVLGASAAGAGHPSRTAARESAADGVEFPSRIGSRTHCSNLCPADGGPDASTEQLYTARLPQYCHIQYGMGGRVLLQWVRRESLPVRSPSALFWKCPFGNVRSVYLILIRSPCAFPSSSSSLPSRFFTFVTRSFRHRRRPSFVFVTYFERVQSNSNVSPMQYVNRIILDWGKRNVVLCQ